MNAGTAPARALWLTLLLLATAATVVDHVHRLPDRVADASGLAFAVLVVFGLWHRVGSRRWTAAAVALAYGGVAVGLNNELMLRGAALSTAVLTAIFAVVITVPASRFWRALVEVLVAALIAIAGGFAAVAFHAPLNTDAFRYAALVLALAGALAAVYQPGAGLQGLGRRGWILIGGLAVLMLLAVAYSLALTHWGSHYVTNSVDDVRAWLHDTLGASPHLLEVVVGVPSLCWGVYTRARRRQGWWMCAFGVALTAPVAAALAGGAVTRVVLLGSLYSLVLGALLGLVVIRLDQVFTGSRGRRARRTERAAAHRPEPARWAPLR